METDPPRNSRLRLIRADEGRGWAPSLLPACHPMDEDLSVGLPVLFFPYRTERSPMPEKTHATRCGAAASMLCIVCCASNSAGGR